MRTIRHFLDARLIGRGIAVGLCALACFGTLPFSAARVAAAGYTVTTTSDSGTGSLRDAITQVNAGAGTGDTIAITATGTITLASALPALNKPVAITGPGATMLTVDGTHAVRVFLVDSGVTASVANLTIANGNADAGGGIENGGTLTVTNSTLSGNTAANDIGGGGIANSGMLTVRNSTLSGNTATGAFGGGGGIYSNGGTVTVTNSTLASNRSFNDSGGIYNYTSGTLTMTNTIVAGNTATRTGPDIKGAVVSHGHNLIGSTSGSTGITNGTNGDIVNPMPLLDTLKDNGGTTPLPNGSHVKTRALLPGSPAIGAGDSSVCNSTTTPPGAPVGGKDQRGFPRPPTTCAIGAFEPQGAPPTITLSPATLPNGTLGAPYSQAITATGGTAPYTFAVTSGALPPASPWRPTAP